MRTMWAQQQDIASLIAQQGTAPFVVQRDFCRVETGKSIFRSAAGRGFTVEARFLPQPQSLHQPGDQQNREQGSGKLEQDG